MSGTLYIVATPIGNLEDLTYRAVRILGEVDLIACEDTRHTRKLLDHYGIRRPVVSYHEHNEQARATQLLDGLRAGSNIALVSDAGTPLIADPGYRIVEKARAEGIAVVPVPGPSAVIAALSASGLPAGTYLFAGFLPAKSGQRRAALERFGEVDATLVLYEAPHRIVDALTDIDAVLGARPLVLARELTKLHEEFLSGTPAELIVRLQARETVKGEFTIMIGKAPPAKPDQNPETIQEAVEALIRSGVPRMDALKQIAAQRGLGKREIYKAFMKDRAAYPASPR